MKLNDEDYNAKLAYLKDLEPNNDIIPKLERGNSALNSLYLTISLDKALAKKKADEPIPNQTSKSKDKSLSSNEIRLRHLRLSRAELSNSFYLCRTDQERASVSKSIIKLNKEIKQLIVDIDTKAESRNIPENNVHNPKYPVPEDTLEMYKKMHSLRTSITRMQKDIERLKLAGANEKSIMAKESKLNHNIIYKAYVERAIQSAKAI